MKHFKTLIILLTLCLIAACETLVSTPQERFTVELDGLTASFNASTITGNPSNYQWDFGDGNTSEGQTTKHSYKATGSYQVTLNVTLESNESKSIVGQVFLINKEGKNQAPISAFTATPVSGEAALEVTLKSTSSDPDGTVISHKWDLGDGSTSDETELSHTYIQAGTYLVKLLVTDDKGASNQSQESIIVTAASEPNPTEPTPTPNQAPTVSIKSSSQTGVAPHKIMFAASAEDKDGKITSYLWDLGDGTTTDKQEFEYEYSKAGTYVVSVEVEDDLGAKANARISIVITEEQPTEPTPNQAPTVSIKSSTTSGPAVLKVSFAGIAEDKDGIIKSYEWDFGDGTTGAGQELSHAFEKPSTYTVTLVVTDDQGAQAKAETQITVTKPNEAPKASLIAKPIEGDAPLQVDFVSTSTDDGKIIRHSWNFGDNGTALGEKQSYIYNKPGKYTVQLRVEDDQGLTDTAEVIIVVNLPKK